MKNCIKSNIFFWQIDMNFGKSTKLFCLRLILVKIRLRIYDSDWTMIVMSLTCSKYSNSSVCTRILGAYVEVNKGLFLTVLTCYLFSLGQGNNMAEIYKFMVRGDIYVCVIGSSTFPLVSVARTGVFKKNFLIFVHNQLDFWQIAKLGKLWNVLKYGWMCITHF